jgi:hypothetical protein
MPGLAGSTEGSCHHPSLLRLAEPDQVMYQPESLCRSGQLA